MHQLGIYSSPAAFRGNSASITSQPTGSAHTLCPEKERETDTYKRRERSMSAKQPPYTMCMVYSRKSKEGTDRWSHWLCGACPFYRVHHTHWPLFYRSQRRWLRICAFVVAVVVVADNLSVFLMFVCVSAGTAAFDRMQLHSSSSHMHHLSRSAHTR